MRSYALLCCALACGSGADGSAAPPAASSASSSTANGVVTVSVIVNQAPRVESVAAPSPLLVGQPASVSATAVDGDGDPLTWHWSSDCEGVFADAKANQTTFTLASRPANGSCSLKVEADDGRGGEGTGALVVQAGAPVILFPPKIEVTVQGAFEAIPGEQVGFEVYADDPQGGALRFDWGSSAGSIESAMAAPGHGRAVLIAPACSSEPAAVWAEVSDDAGLTSRASFELRVPCR